MTLFEMITIIIGAGMLGALTKQIFNYGKYSKTLDTILPDISTIKTDVNSINENLRNIDGRLNRLEGAFFERGQWEARSYKIGKDNHWNKH
jgi:hypothetical protein